jgi:hypothetical protein
MSAGLGDSLNPYASPATIQSSLAPTVRDSGAINPTRLDIRALFARSWDLFGQHWGKAAWAIFLSMAVVMIVAGGLTLLVNGTLLEDGQDPQNPFEVDLSPGQLALNLITAMFAVLIYLGMSRYFVSLVRGRQPMVSELFSGYRFFGRAFLAHLILLVLNLATQAATIRPAFSLIQGRQIPPENFLLFVAAYLVFLTLVVAIQVFTYPLYFLQVDTNVGPLESLRWSMRITKGNRLWILLLVLLEFVLIFAGAMACLVGALFTYGFALILRAVAYLMMSGYLGPATYEDSWGDDHTGIQPEHYPRFEHRADSANVESPDADFGEPRA